MTALPNALHHWKTEAFAQTLKAEIEGLKSAALPLEKALTQGGVVEDSDISVAVITTAEDEKVIEVKIGVFFTEIVAGCSCGDAPMSINAYCQLLVSLDKMTSEASFTLMPD